MSFDLTTKIKDLMRPWWHQRRASQRFHQFVRLISAQPDFQGPILYDIGARFGASPPYDRLRVIPSFRTVGFEADSVEAEKLRTSKIFDYMCSVALGARHEKRVLHIAKDPGSSSLFPPDQSEIARHTTWRLFETVRQIEVSVEPLDQVIEKNKLPMPDYIKIDCEGAEGEIFTGAQKALNHSCGLTFEARFRQFYKGGSTFSELIDQMFDANFVCLRQDPIGSFFGSLMMFDVVMVRHPDTIRDRRQFILCLLFCLLHGKWLYAQRTFELRAADFDCGELRNIFSP
jgi:FkbM family methyltransferase